MDGIFPPLPTSFDKNGEVAVDAIKRNLAHLDQFDLGGYVVLGSNGEFVLLRSEEKLRVLEAARGAIPREKLMLAGTGCQATAATVKLTQKAAETGANAALVIHPSYYRKLMTPETLMCFFHTVADESPIPIILYNMPACTGIDMDAGTIVSLSRHPNIVGLKDSSGNIVKIGAILREAEPGFQILAGSGGFLLPALSVGAVGGVPALANIAPQNCIDIHRYFREGNLDAARDLQVRMIPVNTAVTARWGVPALKAAMDMLGMTGGPVRRPLLPISPEIREQLKTILKTGGITLP